MCTKFDIYVFISEIVDYHNREKLATQGTQDKTKQKHNTTYVLDTNIRKQTQIT